MRNIRNVPRIGKMYCLRCEIELQRIESRRTGFCLECRRELVPSHIPEIQHERYLRRIGSYDKYKNKDSK